MRRKKYKTKSKSKKNSKQLRKYIKRKREETGIYERRHFIYLTCNKCKKEYKIRVNDKSIYTEEIIKNWICIFCRHKRR